MSSPPCPPSRGRIRTAGEAHDEARAAKRRRAVDGDGRAVMASLLSNERQAEAGDLPVIPEPHERLEDARAVGVGPPRAVVLDDELRNLVVAYRHPHLAVRA